MPQDLKAAAQHSAYVLDLIGKQVLTPEERVRVTRESVQYWTDHVNEGFLKYRKSVSTDYTAVEWRDEGAVFQDINGKEYIDCLGGYGIYGDELADGWVHLPNTNALFNGATPLDVMLLGGIPAMERVRALLDARRGGA